MYFWLSEMHERPGKHNVATSHPLAQKAALIDKRIRPGCIVICHRGIEETKPSSNAYRSRGFPVVCKAFRFTNVV